MRHHTFTALVLALASAAQTVKAACECGYLDPATNALWTDATITYFNETEAQDIVLRPSKSPHIYGQETAGDTGTGQQSWAVVGDHVNVWEDSFGATFRSAVSYNNTYIDDDYSLGLAMQVSTPDMKHRIVNGSQIVTRRRDILYGSFRAMIQHADFVNEGAGFKFAVAYNQSETIDTSVMVADIPGNSTLQWSYSATSQDAMPRKFNLSWLDTSAPVEHRMDWLNHKQVQFRNNGLNDTINFGEYVKGKNATNLPSVGAPVSFQAWANGEPSGSQGPPVYTPLVTHVLYVRFFYNSTLAERHTNFTSQCSAVAAVDAICSTEDNGLRGSTPFSLASIAEEKPVKTRFHAPLYAIIVESVALGFVLIVIAHGMVVRKANQVEKKRLTEEARLAEEKEEAEETKDKSNYSGSVLSPSFSEKSLLPSARSSVTIPLPELLNNWDSDSDMEDDEYDDVEPITGDIEGSGDWMKRRLSMVLPAFFPNKHSSISSPPAAMNRLSSFRFDSAIMSPSALAEKGNRDSYNPYSKRKSVVIAEPTSSDDPNYSRRNSNWQPRARPQAIVRWGKLNGDDSVGQLAQPRTSIATLNRQSRRQSVLFAQTSLLQTIYKRMHDAIFISSSGMTTSTGERRIDYLDGLRGFACLFVSVGHFFLMFYNSIANPGSPQHYPGMEKWLRISLGAIVCNAGLVLGIFFLLPARTMCQRYLLNGGLQSMADSTVRRIPRLLIPVLGACLANYFMIDINAYKWVPRLASRTWSTWVYFQNYDNVMDFVNAFITLWWAAPPASPALVTGYATGVLWTIPLMVQGMWTCMLSALVAHELKTAWKRFTFYGFCVFLSWYANTWDMFFMSGLIIADLDANLKYRDWAAKGVPLILIPKVRIHGRYFAWVFMLACMAQQWIAYYPEAPLSSFSFDVREFGIHPNWRDAEAHNWDNTDVYSYVNPRVSSWLWVMAIMILVDLSPNFQTLFRLKIWSFLGKHSMAYFLCHGIIFWTWGAWLCLTLLAANCPYWAAVLVVFITSYFWLTLLCICFTYTFEMWSIIFSKACWRAASGGLGRKV